MKSSTCKFARSLACSVFTALFFSAQSMADGTEQLGPPSIDIASGSDILLEGVGLWSNQPGTIGIEVPFEASVEQVLLYWSGRSESGDDPGTNDTILVNGAAVTGMRIGGPTLLPRASHAYRADITDMEWVLSGMSNVLEVSGLDFSYQNDGAAAAVIVEDGSMNDIQIVDGNDFAYLPYGYQTVPVDFPFAAAPMDRTGVLKLIVTDLDVPRPAVIDITVDGVTNRLDVLKDNEGDYLDVVEIDILIPAGVTSVTAQLLSVEGDLHPASLAWIFASFQIPEAGGCTYTQGYWKNHPDDWPTDQLSLYSMHEAMLILWTPPKKGNAYLILAHQYIAAELNMINGASVPEAVDEAWSDAQELLAAYAAEGSIPKKTSDRDDAIDLATLLDAYNNGVIGPGHCDDD